MRHWPLRITLLCTGGAMTWASQRILEADRLALPHPSEDAMQLLLGGMALITGTLLWWVLSALGAGQTSPIQRGFEVVTRNADKVQDPTEHSE